MTVRVKRSGFSIVRGRIVSEYRVLFPLFSIYCFAPTFLILDTDALGLDDPGMGFIPQFPNSFRTPSFIGLGFIDSSSSLTTRFFSPAAGLGYYKMAFGKQVIGLQVSDCWTLAPLRDTRLSTTVPYQNTSSVLSSLLTLTPRR